MVFQVSTISITVAAVNNIRYDYNLIEGRHLLNSQLTKRPVLLKILSWQSHTWRSTAKSRVLNKERDIFVGTLFFFFPDELHFRSLLQLKFNYPCSKAAFQAILLEEIGGGRK